MAQTLQAARCRSSVFQIRLSVRCRLPLTAVRTLCDCQNCDQTTVTAVDDAWSRTVEVSLRAAAYRRWTTASRRPHCPMKRPDWRWALLQAERPARRGDVELLQRPRWSAHRADDKRCRIWLRCAVFASCHTSTSSFNGKNIENLSPIILHQESRLFSQLIAHERVVRHSSDG